MATVCYCSLAVDVFTAGVAHNKTRDYFTSVLVSCLLRFRALLLTAFACCHAMPCSKPGCQLPAAPPGRSTIGMRNLQLALWTKFGRFHSTSAAWSLMVITS